MKNILKRALGLSLSMVVAFCAMVIPVSATSSGAPRIKKIEYEGKGIVEVDFNKKIRYGKYKVIVKDLKGRTYSVKILERDNDEIKFRVVNYRKNHTYRFSITNIKNMTGAKTFTLSGTVPIEIKKAASDIGIARAKQIAAGNVGLKASQIKFKKAKRELEKGRYVYEIEFRRGYYEYEYEILASNGKILHREIEYDR